MTIGISAFESLAALPAKWSEQLANMLLSPGSDLSLLAIACSMLIAASFLLRSRGRDRPVPMKVLVRALFPRRLWRSASGKADMAWTFFNILVAGMLFGWALVSAEQVRLWVEESLRLALATPAPTALPAAFCTAAMTVGLYLAYELAYWIDHYLSHKVPVLWRFHAVHHSAETLSPLTNFRVHPIDTIVFYNIVALFMGTAEAVLNFSFGRTESGFEIGGTNVLLLAAGMALTHLQHSHLWISFTGRWGQLILSPAHHQIHHSADPRHFDRNFGGSLALWDWLFGTLHVPPAKREKLSFGVETPYNPHSLVAGIAGPLLPERPNALNRALRRSA